MAPQSEEARFLRENGLVLTNPEETPATTAFNDGLSTVAVRRGDDPAEWGRIFKAVKQFVLV